MNEIKKDDLKAVARVFLKCEQSSKPILSMRTGVRMLKVDSRDNSRGKLASTYWVVTRIHGVPKNFLPTTGRHSCI